MSTNTRSIREIAQDFDDALETRDVNQILPFFSEDCVIELLGVKLVGKKGVRKWVKWMFRHLKEVRFEPVTIMVEGNTFFEEFIVHAWIQDGTKIISKQSEVLIYEGTLLKHLRIYFDRLDFVQAVAKGFVAQRVFKYLIKKSLEGLVDT